MGDELICVVYGVGEKERECDEKTREKKRERKVV